MKRLAAAALAGLTSTWTLACYTPPDLVALRVELPAEAAAQFSKLEVLPHIAELKRAGRRGVVALELKRDARQVELRLPGACPRRINLRKLPRTGTALTLEPLFDLGPNERVVGLGADFTLRATANCESVGASKTSFTLTGGARLERASSANPLEFSGTTRRSLLEVPNGGDIVAISAHAQRELRSEITFTAVLPDGSRYEQVLGVSAVARSSGLSDVGTGHPVLLSGDAWQLAAKPPDSHAELQPLGALFELTPDVPGPYRLTRRGRPALTVHSGRYDQTPLDCGRADCHAEITRSAALSPMTRVLASDLGGCHSLDNPACASGCHATGEPGTADGGFVHAQRELGLGALPEEYEDLPHALQRLGGVGCMACHGPSKIPAPDERLRLLRNDVCAVCHDAPPRYGHVRALQASRMGHADHAVEQRQGGCARCHTGWGALGRKQAPENVEAAGITCSTCHDVHPHGTGHDARATEATESLLRNLPLPETLPGAPASFSGVSRVCVSCHAPTSNTLRPEASAAAIVAGLGGFEPLSGEPLVLQSPHASHAKGCLSCHDSGQSELQLGKSHGFRATEATCGRCHQQTPQRDPGLTRRAQQLLAQLDPARSSGSLDQPWHARYELVLPTPQQTRALRNVLMVLEDPAADVHHPAYAKSLLDAAERFLSGAKP